MTTPHKATPEDWRTLEGYASCGEYEDSCLLELRDRIASLEDDATEQSKSAHFCFEAIIQRVEALEAAANLQQQDEDAERAMEGATAGGLVERVRRAIAGDAPCSRGNARAAILAVAEWLDTRGQHGCSLWLREEVNRG